MTVFHLLLLPLVAMEHVLSIMNPFELIDLSLTSSRVKRAVKTFLRIRNRFRITLDIYVHPGIKISGEYESWKYCWTSDESKVGYETDSNYGSHEIVKFSKNPMEELKRSHDYFKEILNCSFETLFYELDSFPSENESITDWLRSQYESVHLMEVVSDLEGFDDDLKYLVTSFKISGILSISVPSYGENFQMEIPESIYCLNLSSSSFIGYEQFQKLKQSEIILHGSILTDQEINCFLKSWMSMESHLELELFRIRTSGPEAKDVIMDVPHEVTTEPSVLKMLNESVIFSIFFEYEELLDSFITLTLNVDSTSKEPMARWLLCVSEIVLIFFI
uniref:F-box domain-containing protein n=1 Tax=Caenorhabditis tropicalis TaxID=1561998 RepID=A0A1I7TUP4_9PELO